MLSVQRQPGTNTIEIVNNIRKLIPHFYSHGAAVHQSLGRIRSLRSDPRVGERRPIHSPARHFSGHSCDLPFSAQSFRHDHAEPGRSDVDHGHVRGDVLVRLHN